MFLGNVLFDVTPTFPFIIPLPFPIGNGGFLNVSPEGGLLIASSNSSGGIRLDSLGHGIYGNETFLDSITMADGLTFYPCQASFYCQNPTTFKISGTNIVLDGIFDVSSAHISNNFTLLNNSAILFGNGSGGYILPQSGGNCDLIVGPSSTI